MHLLWAMCLVLGLLLAPLLRLTVRDTVCRLEAAAIATCADWELAGGWTTENGQRKKDEGILEKFEVSLEEAQTLVMTARVMLGWVDPTEMAGAADDADADEEEEAEA